MTRSTSLLGRSAAAVALAAAFTACGPQSTAPSGPAALVPVTVSVDGLNAPRTAGLGAQGVPFNDDGTPAVKSVHVKVYVGYVPGRPNETLRFDPQGTLDPNGTRDYVELTPGGSARSTVQVRLPPGSYTFEATGLTLGTGGVVLAYQLLRDQPISGQGGGAPDVLLPLRTIIGRATLEPLVPVTFVYPGEILDLQLVVQTSDAGGGKRYTVPLADFDFLTTPGPGSSGINVVTSSQLGERIQIDPSATSTTKVTLNQRVRGYRDADVQSGSLPVTFSRPLLMGTQLGVDLQRPELTVVPHVGRSSGTLLITASDVAMASVDVFDGIELVAALGDNGQDPSYSSSYLQDVPHDFTVVATDQSGNENRVRVHTDAEPPYCPEPETCP